MALRRAFTAHPHAVNETYLEHAGIAFSFAWRLMAAGGAALVHALVPCLFERTASSMLAAMHAEMAARAATDRH